MSAVGRYSHPTFDLMERTEQRRRRASDGLVSERRNLLAQVFTPKSVAERIAAQLRLPTTDRLTILDPGAGVGSLAAAVVARVLSNRSPNALDITAVEIDAALHDNLADTLEDCRQAADGNGIQLTYRIVDADFISWAAERLSLPFTFFDGPACFDVVVQNPPYGKIGSSSPERRLISGLGIEVPNIYAAFLSLGFRLLKAGGQMSAITPRSFANGRYFKSFRHDLLRHVGIDRLSVFHERGTLFADSTVLQESLVWSMTRDQWPASVAIETSRAVEDDAYVRTVSPHDVVRPEDTESFIHIPTDIDDDQVARRMRSLPCRLSDVFLQVSTGRVVDFRATSYLRQSVGPDTAPLIYPGHLRDGRVTWPLATSRKPNAIVDVEETSSLLLPSGTYVVVKRFSAKEETRRVVAAVFHPQDAPHERVGFENHLNVFHVGNNGIDPTLARGLTLWLNSTTLDLYFRQFSGHTQVNATDLRNVGYPRVEQLTRLGQAADDGLWPDQAEIDELVERNVFFELGPYAGDNAVAERHSNRVQEARDLLRALNFDAERSNERSALVLLALLKLRPNQPWAEASSPLLRTVEIMDFIRQYYERDYKPNTRETIRRQTLHQFADVGLVVQNPDQPDRPINSPRWCYQINPSALAVFQVQGGALLKEKLRGYLVDVPGLRDTYAAERAMRRIPVALPDGSSVTLSPGGQNELIRAIIEDFCSYYTPGGKVLYVGDAGGKWQYFAREEFEELGIVLDEHGKMPDIVVYLSDRDWLIIIEAASSHGPVDAKRHGELKNLFAAKVNSLVFVSCFPTRADMRKDLAKIAWETDVWCADAKTHLIHFNGERFLGPYAE
jgi:adenine-specific DNA-methyltransferase